MNIGEEAYKGTPQIDLKEVCKKKKLTMIKLVDDLYDGYDISLIFIPKPKSIFKKPLFYQEYFNFDDNEPESEFYRRVLRYLERKEEDYE